MIRVNIICEGQTEEKFVKNILYPHFISKNIQLVARVLGTSSSYPKLRKFILNWLKAEPDVWVTTLVDLYGMDPCCPGYQENKQERDNSRKILAIESAIKVDILSENTPNWRFIPYLQLHEFEALLFSDGSYIEKWLSLDRSIPVDTFTNIRNQFPTPEDINDNPLTAPSKRIISIAPGYKKTLDGMFIIEDIGLDKIRAACYHFNEWMLLLEGLLTSHS